MSFQASHSVVDIADYFLAKSAQEKTPLTNLKLQRMVYIANGLYLAYVGQPLFFERIESPSSGPYIRNLYNMLKKLGNEIVTRQYFYQFINKRDYSIDLANRPDFSELSNMPSKEPEFNEKEKEVLEATWDTSKKLTEIQLANFTTAEDSPWSKAFKEGKNIIPDDYIIEGFKKYITPEEKKVEAH